jgi:Cft2 family RNA processing exonuclease
VVIPAFAVGRVQVLLHYFERIKSAGGPGNVPIFLDGRDGGGCQRDLLQVQVGSQTHV